MKTNSLKIMTILSAMTMLMTSCSDFDFSMFLLPLTNMHLQNLKYNFGRVPLCNLRAERAPHIGKFVFPLCWRCTGLLVGGMIATIARLILPVPHCLPIAIASCLPLAIDWTVQRLEIKESTNWRRLTTGILLGICQMFL